MWSRKCWPKHQDFQSKATDQKADFQKSIWTVSYSMALKAFQPLQEHKRCWRREEMASCKNFWTDQRNSIPKMAAEHLYLNVSLAGCILGSPSAQTVQRSLLPFRALRPRDSSPPRHSAPSPMNSLALHPFCVVEGRRGGKIVVISIDASQNIGTFLI